MSLPLASFAEGRIIVRKSKTIMRKYVSRPLGELPNFASIEHIFTNPNTIL